MGEACGGLGQGPGSCQGLAGAVVVPASPGAGRSLASWAAAGGGGSASPLPLLKTSAGQELNAGISWPSPLCLSRGPWDGELGVPAWILSGLVAPHPTRGSRCHLPPYRQFADSALTNSRTMTLREVPAWDLIGLQPCLQDVSPAPPKVQAPGQGQWAGGAHLWGTGLGVRPGGVLGGWQSPRAP